MGHFADTLALVENIKAINDPMGFRELDYRIETLYGSVRMHIAFRY